MERVEGQTAEAALPGWLHFTFLRHHGTLEPRFGLGLLGTGIRLEEIVFHLQSKNSFIHFWIEFVGFFLRVGRVQLVIEFHFVFFFFFSLQEHVEGYLQDIFDFERVHYVTVEEMAEDVWSLARQRIDTVARQMPRR